MGSIVVHVDTMIGYISTEITPGHSETNLRWANSSAEAILLPLPSWDPSLKDAVLQEGWCKREMASHQDKEHVSLAETDDCSQISSGTVMLLCSQDCMLYLESHTGKGAEHTSQILFLWETEGVCLCMHVQIHMCTCVHACRKESWTKKSLLLSHSKYNSW